VRRVLLLVAAPVLALVATGPALDRLARRLMQAPRRTPEEAGLGPALDRLGGEVVRLRSRDGVRLVGRWVPSDAQDDAPAGVDAHTDAPAIAHTDAPSDAATPVDEWVPDPREAILLLHGYNGSIAPDLVEVGPFLRRTASVLGLDFRGHGASDDGPTTFGLLEVEDVAGGLAFLGERGVRRVALVGSSMGGITAIAAVAVLGDGRLASADADPAAPAGVVDAPRPRIVGIVADSVTPELAIVVGNRLGLPFGRRIAGRAFGRFDRLVGGDPRTTEPIAVIGLLEDMPLLLVHGEDDRTVPIQEGMRLAAAAPPGVRHLVIPDADHGAGHRTDPVAYEAAATGLLREAFLAARS